MIRFFFILSLLSSPISAVEITPVLSKHCLITKNISLKDLTDKSGIIFRGKFEDFTISEENGLSIRTLVFSVKDVIRGLDTQNHRIKLKEWAKIRSPFGTGEIAKDKEYIFFFNKPSSKGLTSLNGMEQGLVEITENNTLRYSKRLDLGTNWSSRNFNAVSNSLNISSYEGLKSLCKTSDRK